MPSFPLTWKIPMVAVCAALLAMACAASVSGVTVRPTGVERLQMGRLEAFRASLGGQTPVEAAMEAEALSAEAEEPEAGETEFAQGLYGQQDSDEDDGYLAFLEEQLRESALAESAAPRHSVSCSVSFPDGYAASPVVEVRGEGTGHATATAVFFDENARSWLHGVHKGIRIPSSFRFGTEGEDADYAGIHPPRGTGKHAYTVVIYKGSLDSGPLLQSLRGTPWNNSKRAVGSLGAIESDLRRQNAGKPVEELCRCSVHVSYEDISREG
ncbi:hypothetical protein, conserved [Eimeria brunetti]|uniref:Phosphatidylethanolamine-binding protein n=1 Tax=Eimeria brunetti TaxID=51314 RepID=U6LJZ3_9EIME|nr:hypothetical protein, conserved [Eimeria brunetti]